MSLVFYKPPANVYLADAREQCYQVTDFDMVKFNLYGKLTWHVKGVGNPVNWVVETMDKSNVTGLVKFCMVCL